MSGQVVGGRYQIIRQLGAGGFGETYLAQDIQRPGKPHCVVKRFHSPQTDPEFLPKIQEFFEQEAVVLEKLGEHPQIPRLLAHLVEQGELLIVQECVDGQDLSAEILPGKRLSESYVIKLLREVLEVLAFVHQQQVIHRDIKPANLMRRKQDSKIVLIDFGAVKQLGALSVSPYGEVKTTVAIGTPGYSPAEQTKGKPRLSSDIYAVGMVAIQALTGFAPHELPEDPQTGEVIWRNRAQVSDALGEILTQMVRDHFSKRYANATEALQSLNAIVPAAPPIVPTVPLLPQPQPPQKQTSASGNPTRRRILQLLALAGTGTSVTLLVDYARRNPFPRSSPEPTFSNSPQPNSNQSFTEDLGNGATLDMVFIPGGTFKMGSPNTEAQRASSEGPQHDVTVPNFFMGKFEVTQQQYQALMGNNPSGFKGESRPVEQVSWNDATAFCQKLSQKTGRTYRLPTEAEWEYGCRAGTQTPFSFGATITTDQVNYNGNFPYGNTPKGQHRQQTTDVDSFPANALGLHDMHGNVWEWCADDWHDNYAGKPEDLKQNGSLVWSSSDKLSKLIRGGSWSRHAWACRSASRLKNQRGLAYSSIGFRICYLSSRTS